MYSLGKDFGASRTGVRKDMGLIADLVAILLMVAALLEIGCAVQHDTTTPNSKPSIATTAIDKMAGGHKPTRRSINPKDNAEMIYIPAGEFIIGDKHYTDAPPHQVYLDSYYIYKNLVTVAQYRKFCQETGRQMPPAPDWGWKDDHPIVNVRWDDAKAYCDWAGVSLPTEAQWVKAARGMDRRDYPWGNQWDGSRSSNSVGNNHASSTSPVGSYPSGASPYGVLDMAGNVWQWCSDWYDSNYYQNMPLRNPGGPASGTSRVLRGASWFSYYKNIFLCASRGRLTPNECDDISGFRCVARAGF